MSCPTKVEWAPTPMAITAMWVQSPKFTASASLCSTADVQVLVYRHDGILVGSQWVIIISSVSARVAVHPVASRERVLSLWIHHDACQDQERPTATTNYTSSRPVPDRTTAPGTTALVTLPRGFRPTGPAFATPSRRRLERGLATTRPEAKSAVTAWIESLTASCNAVPPLALRLARCLYFDHFLCRTYLPLVQ